MGGGVNPHRLCFHFIEVKQMYEYYVELELPLKLKEIVDNSNEVQEFSILKKGLYALRLKAWSQNQIRDMFDTSHQIRKIEFMRALS
jgi:hypothetical protein